MIGWGLSQVSLALFFQVFISKARTSTSIFLNILYTYYCFD